MEKSFKVTLLVVAFVTVSFLMVSSSARASGPWKGQLVDAETGKPLESVVVLAYWLKYTESLIGHGGSEFYDAEEVVTGPDGRFVIQARSTWTLNPFRRISGMELVIFKPGYGRWRFRGSKAWPKDAYERKVLVQKAWEQFEGEGVGVVMELPPLKTREERRGVIGRVGTPTLVPLEKTKRLEEAVNAERAYLGFRN